MVLSCTTQALPVPLKPVLALLGRIRSRLFKWTVPDEVQEGLVICVIAHLEVYLTRIYCWISTVLLID